MHRRWFICSICVKRIYQTVYITVLWSKCRLTMHAYARGYKCHLTGAFLSILLIYMQMQRHIWHKRTFSQRNSLYLIILAKYTFITHFIYCFLTDFYIDYRSYYFLHSFIYARHIHCAPQYIFISLNILDNACIYNYPIFNVYYYTHGFISQSISCLLCLSNVFLSEFGWHRYE